MAIIKYVALKFGPDSVIGSSLEEKAEVEMLASVLTDLLKQANLKCYITPVDQREQLGHDLIHKMKEMVNYVT